jgi:hypothetical protein
MALALYAYTHFNTYHAYLSGLTTAELDAMDSIC